MCLRLVVEVRKMTTQMSKHWKIMGLYFSESKRMKKWCRDVMLERYLDESENDVEEALALMAFRLQIALREEAYEECAIIKDILDEFEYIPD